MDSSVYKPAIEKEKHIQQILFHNEAINWLCILKSTIPKRHSINEIERFMWILYIKSIVRFYILTKVEQNLLIYGLHSLSSELPQVC